MELLENFCINLVHVNLSISNMPQQQSLPDVSHMFRILVFWLHLWLR